MTVSSIGPKLFSNTTKYCYSMNHTYSINVYVFVTKYQRLHWDNKKILVNKRAHCVASTLPASFIIFNYDLCKKHIFLHQQNVDLIKPPMSYEIIRNLLRFSFVSGVSFYHCLISSRPANAIRKMRPINLLILIAFVVVLLIVSSTFVDGWLVHPENGGIGVRQFI